MTVIPMTRPNPARNLGIGHSPKWTGVKITGPMPPIPMTANEHNALEPEECTEDFHHLTVGDVKAEILADGVAEVGGILSDPPRDDVDELRSRLLVAELKITALLDLASAPQSDHSVSIPNESLIRSD